MDIIESLVSNLDTITETKNYGFNFPIFKLGYCKDKVNHAFSVEGFTCGNIWSGCLASVGLPDSSSVHCMEKSQFACHQHLIIIQSIFFSVKSA